MSDKTKILIIELGGSHFELIPSHILFLKKRNFEIFYAGDTNYQAALNDFKSDISNSVFIQKPKKIKQLHKIRKFIIENKIGLVLFNTATGKSMVMLSLLIPLGVRIIGVMHNIEKMFSSNTQKMLSWRVKDYFVLSKFLYKNVMPKAGNNHKFQYYYPIYYGNFQNLKKNENVIKVVIPGRVELARRDYFGLLEELKSVPKELMKNFNFQILGDINKADGLEIASKIEKYGLNDFFELYDSFIADKEFHQIIANSDYVMPLAHPCVFEKNKYNTYKISGSFNLAFGHQKPLLIHESLKPIGEFDSIAVFYSLEKIDILLQKIIDLNKDKTILNYKNDERFDEKKQEDRFFQLIN